MPCYYPWQAFKLANGTVVSSERGDVVASFFLPCGQCIGCRLKRSREWAIRCVHESQDHEFNSFITLTYDDDHLPADLSLNYRDFQLFMKRVRAKLNVRVRFFCAGEYGELFLRPHFHAILFGVDFPDKLYLSTLSSGFKIYRSPLLESLWPYGFSSVGAVSFESAAYVARYCMKKVTGSLATEHYTDKSTGVIRAPEFCHMSLKPGIGANWLSRFRSDVRDGKVVRPGGAKFNVPRFYDKKMEEWDRLQFDDVKMARELESYARRDDNTRERLAVKEVVQAAQLKSLKRKID